MIDRDAGKAAALVDGLLSNTRRTGARLVEWRRATEQPHRQRIPSSPAAERCPPSGSIGIEALTIHELRCSFSLQGESAGAPAGAIAQVMGHKPSATAEGYRPRSVDALSPYLALIEAAYSGISQDCV